jgi:hypothetical protein
MRIYQYVQYLCLLVGSRITAQPISDSCTFLVCFLCFRSTLFTGPYTRHGCWSWTEPTNHRRHMVFLIKTTDNQGPDTLRPFHNSSLFCRAGFFRHPVSYTAGRHNRCLAFLVTIGILCHPQFRPKKHCHK